MRLASELLIRRLGLGTGAEAGASVRNYVIWTFLLRSHGHGFERLGPSTLLSYLDVHTAESSRLKHGSCLWLRSISGSLETLASHSSCDLSL